MFISGEDNKDVNSLCKRTHQKYRFQFVAFIIVTTLPCLQLHRLKYIVLLYSWYLLCGSIIIIALTHNRIQTMYY